MASGEATHRDRSIQRPDFMPNRADYLSSNAAYKRITIEPENFRITHKKEIGPQMISCGNNSHDRTRVQQNIKKPNGR